MYLWLAIEMNILLITHLVLSEKYHNKYFNAITVIVAIVVLDIVTFVGNPIIAIKIAVGLTLVAVGILWRIRMKKQEKIVSVVAVLLIINGTVLLIL